MENVNVVLLFFLIQAGQNRTIFHSNLRIKKEAKYRVPSAIASVRTIRRLKRPAGVAVIVEIWVCRVDVKVLKKV